MKLFDFYKTEVYGVGYTITLLKGKRRSLFQFEFGLTEYPDLPYLSITFGNNQLFGVLCWCWKFSFAFDILGITWKSWDKDDDLRSSNLG